MQITLDDVLTGHNFPDGNFWRTRRKDYIDDLLVRMYSREEAETISLGPLRGIVDGLNYHLADPDYHSDYIDRIRVWLSANGR